METKQYNHSWFNNGNHIFIHF